MSHRSPLHARRRAQGPAGAGRARAL